MYKPTLILLPALFILATFGYSQPKPALPAPGNIAAHDLLMTECAFDSGAAAMMLFQYAETIHEPDNGNMVTSYRKRYKVLRNTGLDLANLFITYYSDHDFETIHAIEGETYNISPSGTITTTAIDKKSIYKEKVSNFYSRYRIPMPNVVVGSVFEIRYISTMKSYGGLDNWDFQQSIPVRQSAYLLELPPNTEFAYTIQKKPELPIVVKPMPNEGKVYFEMNEVPGLDYEPFMDAPRNYIQRVTFQLSKYINYFGGHKVSTNWEELATDMLRHSAFGGELGKKMDAPGLDALVAAATTTAEKATVIYNWVTKNVKCNCNFYGLYSDGGVKKALSNRLAMPTELNLILVNLLNQYGIEAYPMLAAERQFGKVNPDYPFKDRFNKAVAYAKVEANAPGWVMDASQPYMPAHVTPYNLLNTLGFIVRRKDPALIKIVRPQERFKQQYAIAATLNQAGNLEGKATIASSGYARYLSEQQQKELARNPLAFALEKNHAQLNVTHKEEEKLDSASQAMVRQITFNYNLGEEGQTLYIPTNLLLNLDKNPFNTTRRFSDVNFGYPVLIDYEQTITLPTGVKVKELPPIKVAATPDGQCRFTRSAETRPDGSIRIELMLVQNTTLVPADKYEEIRSFYATVSNLLQEPVVLSAPANGGKP